jgi:hypothetical protein
MCSAPNLWATNAEPQIIAAMSRSRLPRHDRELDITSESLGGG